MTIHEMYRIAGVSHDELLAAVRKLNKTGLHRRYYDLNSNEQPLRGYCLVVSLALLYKAPPGSRAYRIPRAYIGSDEPLYHVFVRWRNDKHTPVDLTAEQFPNFEFIREHYLDNLRAVKRSGWSKEVEGAVQKLVALMGWSNG